MLHGASGIWALPVSCGTQRKRGNCVQCQSNSDVDLFAAREEANGFAIDIVVGFNAPDSPVAGANENRFGDAVLISVADASQHRRVADTGCCEDDMIALSHFVDCPDLCEFRRGATPVNKQAFALVLVFASHTTQLLASETFDRGCRKNGFRATADAEVQIDA